MPARDHQPSSIAKDSHGQRNHHLGLGHIHFDCSAGLRNLAALQSPKGDERATPLRGDGRPSGFAPERRCTWRQSAVDPNGTAGGPRGSLRLDRADSSAKQWSPRASAFGKSWKRRLARIVHRPSDCQTMALRGTPHDCLSVEEERELGTAARHRGYWLACCGRRGASGYSTAKSMKRRSPPGRNAHYVKLCSRHPITSCAYSRARGTATANPVALCPTGNRPKEPWPICAEHGVPAIDWTRSSSRQGQ